MKIAIIKPRNIGAVHVSFRHSSSSEQKISLKLAALTTETTRLAAIYQQKLAALEALKKSLLHQAFSGEL